MAEPEERAEIIVDVPIQPPDSHVLIKRRCDRSGEIGEIRRAGECRPILIGLLIVGEPEKPILDEGSPRPARGQTRLT